MLIAVGVARATQDDDGSDVDSRVLPEQGVDAPSDLLEDLPLPAGAGATSADEAVAGFLDAEVAGDFEVSFGFLSDDDRRVFASPEGWVAGHANVLAPVLDYEVTDTSEGADAASVVATVTFRASLDQVVGLVPGRAEVTWQAAVGEDGAWGVVLDASQIVPIYPDDDGAADAARRWVDARQGCTTPAEERPGLVGFPSLANDLCDAEGELRTGPVEALDESEATPVLTAFGAEAGGAARVVRVTGSVDLGVVLVPVGDAWTVVAVLQ